jgi:opacity protein-like surface antigen
MHSRNRHGPAILRGAILAAFVLVAGLVPAQEAGADPIHKRDGVIFGIGVGVSTGKTTLFPGEEDLRLESGWQEGVVPQIRLGYAVVKNRLLVMVANQQWLYEQGILAEDKLRINAQNWNLVLNWYPGNLNNYWGGLYFQAGAGYANNRLTLLKPIEDDPHGNKFEEEFKVDETGVAYQIGIGYEFRLGKSVAAGAALGYIQQDIDGTVFDNSTVIPFNLTLNWYW